METMCFFHHDGMRPLEGARLIAKLESRLTVLQLREVSLLEKAKQPVARPGGLLVTAVWDSTAGGSPEDISEAGDDGEGEKEEIDQFRSSTQEPGGSAPSVEFSQALSDIPDERVKVTRKEAHDMRTMKKAAEVLVEKVLDVQDVDLTSEDLDKFKKCVKNVRMRLLRMAKETDKKRTGLERPDETFLSSSAFEEFKKKVDAKKLALDSSESAEDEMEEAVVEEEEAVAGRGFYKRFKDLVHHSKDMKRRAAPLLDSVREWCEANYSDIVSAIGYMLHVTCYNDDKNVAALGWRLFIEGTDAILTSEVPHLVALWLVERLRLGRGRYTDTRLLMLR
jgi:hypothetical protein